MNSAQKVVVIVGVGFAALVLAQAVFRSGTPAVFDWEWNKSADNRESGKENNDSIKSMAGVLGISFDDINKMIYDDIPLFEQAIKYGAPEHTPGIFANFGGAEGQPYTVIDDELFLLSGR